MTHSATVSGTFTWGSHVLKIAKTGGGIMTFSEPAPELPEGAEGILNIVIDGHEDPQAVVLPYGVTRGTQAAVYWKVEK